MRIARVDALLDSVQSGGQQKCGDEIRIAARIDAATFDATAAHWNAEVVAPVIAAVTVENRRPRIITHRAAANQAFVAIDGWCGARHQAATVRDQSADKAVSQL